MTGPFVRFLGVRRDADPRDLLGLPPAAMPSRVEIEAALRHRLAQVFRHPDGRSEQAELVRRGLREAADALVKGTAPEPSARGARRVPAMTPGAPARRTALRSTAVHAPPAHPAPPALTEFDRYVLATLVAAGGWNADSRARLVALAGAYGVSAQGLLTVIRGLCALARSGSGPLAVGEITSGAAHLPPPAGTGIAAGTPLAARLAAERLTPELVDDSLWSTVKLSMLFGLVTLLGGVLLLRLVLVDTRPADEVLPGPAPVVATPPPRRPAAGPAAGEGPRLASFRPLPSFLGNALPSSAADAADLAPQVPAQLEDVRRKVSITDDPADVVYRMWSAAIETSATGWVLVDDSTRAAIADAVRHVLAETADSPSVGDRLLEALIPAGSRLPDPGVVWQGTWQAGILGEIASGRGLPPAVVQRARSLLGLAFEGAGVDPGHGFAETADAWLRALVPALVDALEVDERRYDQWEMWLAAQRRLGGGERFDEAVADAIEGILATSTDLARPGPTVNVLGRLLTVADFVSSGVIKERMRDWFEDDTAISTDDLWVLTSLLAQLDTAPWFAPALVLPPDTTDTFRNRIRDRIAAAWPALPEFDDEVGAGGRPVQVDAVGGGRWLSLLERGLDDLPGRDDATRARRLVALAHLNEAAGHLVARRPSRLETMLARAEALLASREPGGPATPFVPGADGGLRAGQPLGRDGEWSAAYTESRRSVDEKVELLRQLRTQGGTDLGPIDAEAFVRAVYRGTPQAARAAARSVLVEQFGAGPNVAMELLDQLVDAPRNGSVSDTVATVTGRVLPPIESDRWLLETRLALVQHVLTFRLPARNELDEMADELLASYDRRRARLAADADLATSLRRPDEAAARLAAAWRDRAREVIALRPTPDTLDRLERRHATRRRLAVGSVQRLVVGQLAALDHLTYVTVAEQPRVRELALEILDRAAVRRREARSVLEQAVAAEAAMARIWAVRMGLAGGGE